MKTLRKCALLILLVALIALISGANCNENPNGPESECAEDSRCYQDPEGQFYSLDEENPCPCAEGF